MRTTTTIPEIVEVERKFINQYTGVAEVDVDLLKRLCNDAVGLHALESSKIICLECGCLNEI